MQSILPTEMLTPAGMTVAALITFRVGGLLWVAPIFSSRTIPMSMKSAFVLLMVVVFWRPAEPGAEVRVTAVTVLSELLIGMTLGLGAGIFVAAAESAGDMLAVQMGLSGANVVNPMSQTQLPVLGQFLALFVTTALLATGGHLAILGALASSLDILPIGGAIDFEQGLWSVIRVGGTQLWLGLRFAAPVIAAMMISNGALGIMARAVPQLNVLMVSFPVQITIGLFMLSATLPLIAMAFQDWPTTYQGMAGDLMQELLPAGGGD